MRTNRDDKLRARFVVLANGTINRPKLPRIAGINDFQGRTFHTCRWDYAYTGGDQTGKLHKLADKRVALIGTGATAIQVVPYLGASAGYLYVFQRTPSSVDLRGNKPTDADWARRLEQGWQKRRQKNFNDVVGGLPFEEDHVSDAWTDIYRNLKSLLITGDSGENAARSSELADMRKMEQIRARVDATVTDPAVAELLKPWYRQFCKRPTFNDAYLPTFNRPNVRLVDTSASRGVERITPTGIVANNVEYPVDCIVFATGFEIGSTFDRRVGLTITGKNGLSLFDHWQAGLRTFHGHSTHGFPNWFYVGNSQNGLSVNYGSVVDGQAFHVAFIIAEALKRGATQIEATAESEEEWTSTIARLAPDVREFMDTCTPGYHNNEGRSGMGAFDFYGPGPTAFDALMTEWRAANDFKGLSMS